MLFASENKYLQLCLATFLQKASAVHNTILSVTLHWSKVAWLCSSPQLTWAHGLFQETIYTLFLSNSLKICFWVLCSSLSLCSYPWRWCLDCTSNNCHTQPGLFFYCFDGHDSKIAKLGSSGCVHFVTWPDTPHFVAFISFALDLWFLQWAFRSVDDPTYHLLWRLHIMM